MESRPYWSWEWDTECEEPWCAEGPARAWSAMADAEPHLGLMVGSWQYQCAVAGYGTRYAPSRYYPAGTTPGTRPPRRHRLHMAVTAVPDRLDMQFELIQGDPRGR